VPLKVNNTWDLISFDFERKAIVAIHFGIPGKSYLKDKAKIEAGANTLKASLLMKLVRFDEPVDEALQEKWECERCPAFHDQEANSVNYLTFHQRMFRLTYEMVRNDTTLRAAYNTMYGQFRPNVNTRTERTLRAM
jgi:hypothetical protein